MRHILAALAACLVWASAMGLAQAHEVRPTIGDLTLSGSEVTLVLDLNVEAFVAGVDLDGLEDTNAVPQADTYDTLRALAPDALAARFAPVARDMAAAITLTLDDGASLPLAFIEAELGPVGDVETLRDSRARFVATADTRIAGVQVTWPEGYGTLILRQIGVVEGYTGFLDGGMTSDRITAPAGMAQSPWATFLTYVPVGFEDILPNGPGHVLFMLAIFFLSLRLAPLVWQVAAFMLGCSVTLTLGAFGLVSAPSGLITPLIAVSIVLVALDNILSPQMSRWRPALMLIFGLLHGLGLAAALTVFGLPETSGIMGLLGYSLGMVLALLTVLAIAYLAVGVWFGDKSWYRRSVAIPASAVIALLGAGLGVSKVFL